MELAERVAHYTDQKCKINALLDAWRTEFGTSDKYLNLKKTLQKEWTEVTSAKRKLESRIIRGELSQLEKKVSDTVAQGKLSIAEANTLIDDVDRLILTTIASDYKRDDLIDRLKSLRVKIAENSRLTKHPYYFGKRPYK